MSRLAAGLLLFAVGCAADGPRVVDGGLVDRDGWPMRPPDAELTTYRCPVGTELYDNLGTEGRRVVSCQLPDSFTPRGFRLAWDDSGRLVSRMLMDANDKPAERKQWFPSGRLAAEEQYVDGQLVRSVSWFENGEQKMALDYDAARNVMSTASYHADGTLEAQGQTQDGKRIGTWREWRDGALEEVEYVAGYQQGTAVRTYPTGDVERGDYAAGQKTGLWLRVDSAGRPVREATYVNGKLNGLHRLYHPNRQLREDGVMLDDEKHGAWKTYHLNGQVQSDVNYACGVLWGEATTYYSSGAVNTRGVYERGRKVGEWKVFSETGVATEVDTHAPITEPVAPAASSCST